MNIRRAVPEDIDTIYELGKAVTEFAVTDNTVTFWPKTVLDNAVGSDDIVMLVAEDDGVAGFLIAQYNDGLKKAVIENVYVHPDKRGRGIDDSLLSAPWRYSGKRAANSYPHRYRPEHSLASVFSKRTGSAGARSYSYGSIKALPLRMRNPEDHPIQNPNVFCRLKLRM